MKINPKTLLERKKSFIEDKEEFEDETTEESSNEEEEEEEDEEEEEIFEYLSKAFDTVGVISRTDKTCVYDLMLYGDEEEYEEDIPSKYKFRSEEGIPILDEIKYLCPFIDELKERRKDLQLDDCTLIVEHGSSFDFVDY